MDNSKIEHWKILVLWSCVFTVCSNSAYGQIKIICPLQNAIIQKTYDSGYLRILCNGSKSKKIKLKLTDSLGNDVPEFGWRELSFNNNVLDTFFTIPIIRKFTIAWHTLDGQRDSGKIKNLSVGHVYAIAGQSNAQGWSPPPFISPHGDVRMLRNDSTWQAGADPTGGKYASPWIEFSNKLQELLKDSLPIGLVNTAIGGTGLVNKTGNGWWQRNDAFHADTSTVYGNALRLFLNAGAKFEALFWIQGESDAVGVTIQQYRSAFTKLVENFQEDFRGTIPFFHLQIGGQIANPDRINWGIIREALRTLPESILVGTAVGSPVGFDGIHYAPITEIMVGDRFAGAIIKEIYHIPNNLFSPLLPENSASILKCTALDPYKGYKIVLGCMENGNAVKLKKMDTLRGFQIRVNGQLVDTSRIFAKVETGDLSKVDIFMKDSSLDPKDGLTLSYAITGDVSNGNLSDNDTSTTLPNYLVSFLDIPILTSKVGVVSSFAISQNIPNPFSDETSFSIYLDKPFSVSYTLFDLSGKLLYSKDAGVLQEGSQRISVYHESLAPGLYQIIFKIGSEIHSFKIIIL